MFKAPVISRIASGVKSVGVWSEIVFRALASRILINFLLQPILPDDVRPRINPSTPPSYVLVAWVVVQVAIFETERADRRHLRDVFAGFRPVEMPGVARQNDDTSRRIGLYLVAVEGLTEPD